MKICNSGHWNHVFSFSQLIKCPRCFKGVDINHCIDEKQVLSHLFEIKFNNNSCQ